jgi:hypothetical protein
MQYPTSNGTEISFGSSVYYLYVSFTRYTVDNFTRV